MWSCGGGCGGSDFCVECGGDEAVEPFVKCGGVFFVECGGDEAVEPFVKCGGVF